MEQININVKPFCQTFLEIIAYPATRHKPWFAVLKMDFADFRLGTRHGRTLGSFRRLGASLSVSTLWAVLFASYAWEWSETYSWPANLRSQTVSRGRSLLSTPNSSRAAIVRSEVVRGVTQRDVVWDSPRSSLQLTLKPMLCA